MRKFILFIALFIGVSFAQRYGTLIPLDSTFTNTDSTHLTNAAGLDSIPAKTGVVSYYSGLEYIGRQTGSYAVAFKADSNHVVGDTPYCQVYLRHLYVNDADYKDWGAWHLISFKKDTADFTSTTVYDSLTYDQQYIIQYKYDTYLGSWHQNNGVQFKVTTLDTFAVVPKLIHWPR